MNRIYKVIWNEALNCFTAVGEYAKARGKSSKSSVSANATINTTDNLSSTSAFKLTAIGLGLMAAGLTMSPQVFAAKGVGNSISIGTANNCANNSTTNTTNASSGLANSVAVGCNSVADLSTDPSITFYNRENPSNLPPVNFSTDTPFNSTAVGTNAKAYQAGTSIGMNASSRSLGIALGVQAKSDNVAAVAIGPAALATGNTSLALGRQSAATENFAQAIGNVASATGVGSLAMGHSAKAEGYRSIAIGSTDIVSARPTDDQPGVIYNPIGQTKAIGVDSIAFGSGAQALGDRSVAIGEGNTVNGANSIAVGTGHIVSGNNSGAFGDPNTVNGMNSYAIGNNNTIAGNNAFVLGNNVTIANGLNGAVGIGNNASVTAINSVALGQGSVATVQSGASFLTNIAANANNGTVAVGAVASERRIINVAAGSSDTDAVNVSQLRALDTIVSDIDFPIRSSSAQPYTTSVTGTDALAVGSNAIANGDRSTAVGENAKAIGIQASAFGAGAEATARSSLASGFKAKAKSGESVALGVRSSAEGLGATAVGPTANARGEDSVALGRRSKADGAGAMALGGFSEAVGENASAVGFNAEASMGGTAIGQSSSAASNATALGRSAIAGQSGNVALGNSSVTTAQHIGSFSINNLPVAGLTSGARTVSVGTVGAERQIQNVAPGVVDANSTDAINGSQLNATNSRVTTNTTNISNNTNAIAEGIKFNVNNSLQRTFALGEEIKFDTDSNLTTTALPSGDGIKLALADIVNVGSGATPVKIDGTARTISGLSNVTFNPATTYTGGQAATQEQLTAASGALTELGFNITADNKDLGPGEVEDNVKLGETVNFTNADGNLVATVSDNGINYDLAPDITLTSVTISDGINDTTLTTDARGLSVNQSKIVDILDGNVTSTSQQAINGRQLFSTAQSIANNLGGGSVVNTDGTVSTPVYQVNGNDQTGVAGAIEELDKGFNLKTNGANISTVKAGDTIDIGTATGETNIEVAKTGNDIKFKLANNIDLNSVTTGNTVMDTGGITVTNPNRPDRTASLTSRGLTISNGPSVLRSGIDAGNKKITGVAAGDVNQDSTDAVNGSQLNEAKKDLSNKGFKITADRSNLANSKTVDKVKLGETVNYTSADGSIITTVSDNEIDFALGNNLSVGGPGQNGADGVDGFVGVNGADGTSGVAINGSNGTIGLTGPTGVSGTVGVINGVPGVNGGDGITRIVIDDIQVATMEDGLKFAGNTGTTINKKLNETLSIEGKLANAADASGANLRVDSLNGKLNVVMAKNLTDLDTVTVGSDPSNQTFINRGTISSKALNVNAGRFVVEDDKVSVALGTNVSMGGNQVHNVVAGAAGTDAVNVDQLNGQNTTIVTKGLNFAGNDNINIHKDLGTQLKIVGSLNPLKTASAKNIRTVENNGQLEIQMADALDVTSVTTGNTVMDNGGVSFINSGVKLNSTGFTITNIVPAKTVSLTSTGLNNGGNVITNVARGEATTDAVNVGQLNEVKQSATDANKGWNISAQGANISTVKPSDTVDLNNTDNNITVSKTAESNNVTFNLSKDIAIDSVKTGDATMNSSGLTIVGGPKLTKTSVDAGSNKITNVANGFIEVASKDAVNGGQLFEFLSLVNTQTTVIAEMGAGLNFDADSGPVINKKAGSAPLTFKGGNNITTTSAGSSIKFDLNGNINVDSVTTGDTTVSTNGVVIAGGPSITKAGIYAGNGETAPSMTAAGINAAGTKITNVADGMQPRDAVNFGQLDAVNRNLGNSINELGYRIGEVEDDANAGISAAMAMSSLPQAYIIGKSMIGGGIATYNGESAVAIGFSKLSADGRWVMKLNGTADTQGNVGAAIGAGFHFD